MANPYWGLVYCWAEVSQTLQLRCPFGMVETRTWRCWVKKLLQMGHVHSCSFIVTIVHGLLCEHFSCSQLLFPALAWESDEFGASNDHLTWEDPYTEQLIRVNRSSGSPLIHRGYWSRVEAIRQTVLRFVQEAPAGGVQVATWWIGGLVTTWRNIPRILSKVSNWGYNML